jgi:hypothetical protein
MKCYEVSGPMMSNFISVTREGERFFLLLGEEGRGRTLTKVPVSDEMNKTMLSISSVDEAQKNAVKVGESGIGVSPNGTATLMPSRRGEDDRALVVVRISMGYRGTVEHEYDVGSIRVLAFGVIADGAAGRMGSYKELLVVMNKGSEMKVTRKGRLYGAPDTFFITWNGDFLTVALPGDHYRVTDDNQLKEV